MPAVHKVTLPLSNITMLKYNVMSYIVSTVDIHSSAKKQSGYLQVTTGVVQRCRSILKHYITSNILTSITHYSYHNDEHYILILLRMLDIDVSL